MVSSKFFEQLTVCSSCAGWGFKKLPEGSPYTPCQDCAATGISLVQSDQILFWGLPVFMDYGQRIRIKILRIVLFLGVPVGIIAVPVLLVMLFKSLM